jgi:hypothetical protein
MAGFSSAAFHIPSVIAGFKEDLTSFVDRVSIFFSSNVKENLVKGLIDKGLDDF